MIKFKNRYKDEYGFIWKHISYTHVKRLCDNNIGGWYNGHGLTKI